MQCIKLTQKEVKAEVLGSIPKSFDRENKQFGCTSSAIVVQWDPWREG